MSKFFVEDKDIFNDKIILKEDNAHHLIKVLRIALNDIIIICDSLGNNFECKIKEIDTNKNIIEVNILSKTKSSNETKINVTLYQSIPKGEKMELIIQKNVELGIKKIIPVYSKFCDFYPKNFEKKLVRYNKIAENSAKQSNRDIIPKVTNFIDFKVVLSEIKNYDAFFVCYEKESNDLKTILKERIGENFGIFIGPEGGFNQEEINMLKQNNAITISLGKRILRTETAGFMFLPILLYENNEYTIGNTPIF